MPKRMLLIAAVLLLLAAVAAACTSDTDDLEARLDTLEAERATLSQQLSDVQRQMVPANTVGTLALVQAVGFHELNMSIREDGVVPADSGGAIRIALRAVAATTWPEELDPAADDFQEKLQAFFDALAGGDLAAQTDTSQSAHDAFHEFTGDAWNFLAEQAGLTAGGGAEEE